MNFKRYKIDDMPKCYAATARVLDGKSELYFAAEGKGCLKKYFGDKFGNCLTLWSEYENLGGTMSIISVPDYEDIFFASTGFFSVMEAEKSKIFMIKIKGNKFEKKEIACVDNIHRFGIITHKKKRYLIVSTIHGGKENMADWSKAGKILACELPMDLNTNFTCELKVLKGDLSLNHGLNICKYNGKDVALIGASTGGYILYPPEGFKDWRFEQIFDFSVSDMLAIDIDSDGDDELVIINPVHGDHCGIYKKLEDKWECVYEPEKYLDFYHGIATGLINGIPTVALGAREEDMDLFIIQYDKEKGEYFTTLIESGVGPMSIAIHNSPDGRDMILSANTNINELSIYILENK